MSCQLNSCAPMHSRFCVYLHVGVCMCKSVCMCVECCVCKCVGAPFSHMRHWSIETHLYMSSHTQHLLATPHLCQLFFMCFRSSLPCFPYLALYLQLFAASHLTSFLLSTIILLSVRFCSSFFTLYFVFLLLLLLSLLLSLIAQFADRSLIHPSHCRWFSLIFFLGNSVEISSTLNLVVHLRWDLAGLLVLLPRSHAHVWVKRFLLEYVAVLGLKCVFESFSTFVSVL